LTEGIKLDAKDLL